MAEVEARPDPAGAPRSYLYVPGDRAAMLNRALESGADALIVDLEDSVAPTRKDAARDVVSEWLTGERDPRCELWIRVNPEHLHADIAATVTDAVTGVILPKADPVLLAEVDRLLGAHCAQPVAVIPLIETAQGLLSVDHLASASRVPRLCIGEVDLSAELGLELSDSRSELDSLRLRVVLASAGAGIGAPIGSTSRDYRDLDSLRDSTHRLRQLGFRARTTIHPAQVPVVNDVFTPTPDQVAEANRLIEDFELAQGEGRGAISGRDGTMVDLAVVRTARDIVARGRREQSRPRPPGDA